MKLGKRAPRAAERALKLDLYLPPLALAPAPVSADWGAGISDWGAMGNLEAGDCTCAAAGHAIMVWSTAAGAPKRPSDAEILAMYGAVSGYNAGNPLTDRGAYISDVLTHWSSAGLGGDLLTAAARIDCTRLEHVKRAIALLGCANLGVELPASAMAQTQAGQTWDSVDDDGGPLGGHCVLLVGYDLDGVSLVTWGQLQRATWSWIARYVDEAWAMVSRDFLTASGAAPNTLDLDLMTADLAALKSS